MFPAMPLIINAALEAGAHGSFLSGAGPTIIAFASEKEARIASAMKEAASKASVPGITMQLQPIDTGTHISEIEE
jgi:homoserine kinase